MDGAAATFDEIVSQQVARDKLCPLLYTLQDSLWRIMDDAKQPDKAAMLAESAGEFGTAALATLTTETAKVGAKMSGARLTKLKAAMSAIEEILTEVEGLMSKEAEKKFDASKLDEATKAHLAAVEKRATDAETAHTALKGEVETLKKAIPPKEDDVWKGVSPEVRKRVEDAEKKAADAEIATKAERDARLTTEYVAKAAKELPNLPRKAEDIGPVLKRLDENSTTDADRTLIRELLAAGNESMKKMFGEIGTTGADSGKSAWDQIEAKASEVMKADANINRVIARDIVMKREPELVSQYQKELRGAH